MKIKIINPNLESCTFSPRNFFRDTFDHFSIVLKDTTIEWSNEGKILAITNVDLDTLFDIPWEETNIIFAETCQQIYDLSYKLDYSKAYIFVTESYADIVSLKSKFHGLPLIAHYGIFNEIFNYGTEMFSITSHMTMLKKNIEPPVHDFFCLIGRQTNLRSRFMYELAKHDLENCLVKYNGKTIGNSGAPGNLDLLDYKNGFFNTEDTDFYLGMRLPSKLIQSSLYNNFKFELQIETDSTGGQGWDIVEYHVTEKTIKPLIMGKPCMMLGPVNYNTWLANYGIDLGLGNFDHKWDSIESDQQRATAIIDSVKAVNANLVQPNVEQHQKNIIGMHRLCEFSRQNTLDLYHQIRLLAS